jgi:signal transduction histidine kinase
MNSVPPILLNTFRVAAGLKLVGVFTALITGYLLVQEWMLAKWAASLVLSITLLFWLLPWPKRFPGREAHLMQLQLIAAIILAIVSPFLELIQSAWASFEPLMSLPLFINRLNWTVEQINDIHALGLLFVMVPVVLASWQYGFWGLWLSQGLAGTFYLITPFLLPADAFTWGIYAVRGFVLLGTAFIVAFIVSTLATAQRREQTAVANANAQLATANRKLAQQSAVLEQLTISQERNRLARELHDTLAHSLSGTAVQLQAVSTLLKHDPEAAVVELAEAQKQIRRGLDESRRAITALRASPLEELGLAEALRQRAQNLAERNGLSLHCQIGDELPDLPPLTEQTLYRVADEALLNVEKHAQASEIRLCFGNRLSVNGNRYEVVLEVWDNGVGFDGERVMGNGRYGLLGMAERADLIGAALQIESQPGKGTSIRLAVSGER